MERRKFIRSCGYATLGIPLLTSTLTSCGSIHYALVNRENDRLVVMKSEFWQVKKEKKIPRDHVLVELQGAGFPILLHKINEDEYHASLMKCTHRGCELNVGGGILTCPCHGSEFATTGKLLEGPADTDLKSFRTSADQDHIYIYHV